MAGVLHGVIHLAVEGPLGVARAAAGVLHGVALHSVEGPVQGAGGVLHGVVHLAVEGLVGVARARLASFMASSSFLWRVL